MISFLKAQEFNNMTSIIKDVVTAIAAGFGIYFANKGLDTWRRQLIGNSKYKASKDVLFSTLELREALVVIRSPMYNLPILEISNEELQKLGDSQVHWRQTVKYYQDNWALVSKKVVALEVAAIEAEALFGHQARQTIQPFLNQITELFVTIQMDLACSNPDRCSQDNDNEFLMDRKQIIYRGFPKSVFDEELQKNLESIEIFFRPLLNE